MELRLITDETSPTRRYSPRNQRKVTVADPRNVQLEHAATPRRLVPHDASINDMRSRFALPLLSAQVRRRASTQVESIMDTLRRVRTPSPLDAYHTPLAPGVMEAAAAPTPNTLAPAAPLTFMQRLRAMRQSSQQSSAPTTPAPPSGAAVVDRAVVVIDEVDDDTDAQAAAADAAVSPTSVDDEAVAVSCPTSPINECMPPIPTQVAASPSIEQQPPPPPLSSERELRSMEATLVTLMDRFRNGDLRAIDEPTMRAMRLVRERQEHLARLHFNLYADDALTDSNEVSDAKFDRLREGLLDLQQAILALKHGEEERERAKMYRQQSEEGADDAFLMM